jgi:uncharacterized damage-inducible protein DinB
MIRNTADFLEDWKHEHSATVKVFSALDDASLTHAVVPGGRTLGRIAWHLTCSLGEMMHRVELPVDCPDEEQPVPATAAELVRAFDTAAASLARLVAERWTDATLLETRDMYGEQWTNGVTLAILIRHLVHHRGQMTAIMRHAGLPVPGVYGPSREEWEQYGRPPLP